MGTILAGRWGSREFAALAAVCACAGAAVSTGSVGRRMLGCAAGGLPVVGVAWQVLSRREGGVGGPADGVTALRAGLAGGAVAAALNPNTLRRGGRSWTVAAFGVPALALDAVDGALARATGTVSGDGARLDMETDAAIFLALSGITARTLAPWTVGIGLARYAFVLGSWPRPAWAGELPPSRRRRAVAGLAGVTLSVGLLPIVPAPVARAVLAAGLGALMWSFAADIVSLERVSGAGTLGPRASRPVTAGTAG